MYNRQQTALIVKSFIDSATHLPDIQKLLKIYFSLMVKGYDKLKRKYISDNSIVINEDVEKMLFVFIILMGFKTGTMKTLGSLVAQELRISDFNTLNNYLTQMNIPPFDIMDLLDNKELYKDYIKS